MPLYDYQCSCGLKVSRRSESTASVTCPVCSIEMRRLFPIPAALNRTYYDGKRRKDWDDVRALSRLRLDRLDERDPEMLKEIDSEIEKRTAGIKGDDVPIGATLPERGRAGAIGTGDGSGLYDGLTEHTTVEQD